MYPACSPDEFESPNVRKTHYPPDIYRMKPQKHGEKKAEIKSSLHRAAALKDADEGLCLSANA